MPAAQAYTTLDTVKVVYTDFCTYGDGPRSPLPRCRTVLSPFLLQRRLVAVDICPKTYIMSCSAKISSDSNPIAPRDRRILISTAVDDHHDPTRSDEGRTFDDHSRKP